MFFSTGIAPLAIVLQTTSKIKPVTKVQMMIVGVIKAVNQVSTDYTDFMV